MITSGLSGPQRRAYTKSPGPPQGRPGAHWPGATPRDNVKRRSEVQARNGDIGAGTRPGRNLMQFVDACTIYADSVPHPARIVNHKMLGRGRHCQPPLDGPGRGRAPPPPHHKRRALCPFPPSPRTRPSRQNRARTTPTRPPPRPAGRGTPTPRAGPTLGPGGPPRPPSGGTAGHRPRAGGAEPGPRRGPPKARSAEGPAQGGPTEGRRAARRTGPGTGSGRGRI